MSILHIYETSSWNTSFFFYPFFTKHKHTGTLNYGSEGVIFGAKRMLRIVTSYGTSSSFLPNNFFLLCVSFFEMNFFFGRF